MRMLILALLIAAMPAANAFAQAPPKPLTPEQLEQLKELTPLIADIRKLRSAGKFKEAIVVYENFLTIKRGIMGNEHPDVIRDMRGLAELHESAEDFPTAKKVWEEILALRIKTSGEDHWQTTDARWGLKHSAILAGLNAEERARLVEANKLAFEGDALNDKEKYAEAILLFEKIVLIRKEVLGEEHPDTARSLNNLAFLYETQKRYDKAEEMHLKALAIRKKILGEKHPDVATSFSNLAFVYEKQRQFEKTEQYFREALRIRKELFGEKHSIYAKTLNSLAHMYHRLNQYAKAEPLFVTVLAIRKEALGEKHVDTAGTMNDLASLYSDMGRYAEAETLHLESLRIEKEVVGEKHPKYATGLNNLATVYNAMAQYGKAETFHLEALRIRKEVLGVKHPDYADSLNNLAFVYDEQGLYAKAVPLYLESMAIRKEVLGEKDPVYATSLDNLASCYDSQKLYAKAEPLFLEGLRIRKEVLGNKSQDYSLSLNNLAGMYIDQGQFAKAEPLYLESLAIRKEVLGEKSRSYGIGLHNLAYCYYHQKLFAKAEPLYLESMQITKDVEGEKHPSYANNLNALAMLYHYNDRSAQAEPLYRQALSIMQDHLEASAAFQSEADQLQSVAASRFNLNNYLNLPKSDDGFLYAAAFRWHGAVTARQTFARIASRSSPEIRGSIESLRDVSRQMNQLVQNPPKAMVKADQAKAIKELDDQRESIEKKLASQSQDFAAYQSHLKLTPADLQKSLPDDTALIDILTHRTTTSVFVITNKSIVHVKMETGEAAREEFFAFTEELSMMRTRPVNDDNDAAAKLRARIWEPLEPHLKGIKRVLICPDGLFCRLPFAALPGADPKKYLLEELSIVIVPVPQLLPALLATDAKKLSGAPSLLAVGDVDFDGDPTAGEKLKPLPVALTRSGNGLSWKPLPNTKGEVEVVGSLFGKLSQATVQKLLGGDATEAALERELTRHRFVHLATHGFFTDPKMVRQFKDDQSAGGEQILLPSIPPGLSSGIVCAGANKPTFQTSGVITATQIAELDLRNVELAVLSACETSLGTLSGGEGVLGLQRAFQMAGARSTITTMWAVYDQSTAELMKRMYSNRLENGLAAAEALREAQLWVLNNGDKVGAFDAPPRAGKRTPPKYWAAFGFSGDWR